MSGNRILHISTRLILGGSQENTVLSCEGQAERGHEVHLAFGPIYGPEGSLLERVRGFRSSRGATISTHEVPSLVREVSPLKDARCLRELETLIERLRPAIVHTHSSKAGILGRIAAMRVSMRTRTPIGVVHTIHGPPFMPIEGSHMRRVARFVSNTAYEIAERIAADHCDVIVSVADAMTEQFLARGIGTPSLFLTVRSGMEVGAFLHARPGEDRASVRALLGLHEGEFVFGTVARLAEHKGHEDVLDALASLRARGEARDARLLWVGDGWWRERLIERASSLGLRVREVDREHGDAGAGAHADVLLTGLVPPHHVPRYLRAMDALVHMSAREGLPRTVPQALLAGVCPIASDVDGTREACMEMQTGRLVPLGDAQALIGAMRWCIQHPERARALAHAGREWAREAFSAEAMLEGLDAAYSLSLDRARARIADLP